MKKSSKTIITLAISVAIAMLAGCGGGGGSGSGVIGGGGNATATITPAANSPTTQVASTTASTQASTTAQTTTAPPSQTAAATQTTTTAPQETTTEPETDPEPEPEPADEIPADINGAGNAANVGLVAVLGEKIFYSNRSQFDRLYAMNTDGSDERLLTEDASFDVNVAGGWVFYFNNDDKPDTTAMLYAIKPDGGGRHKVD